jgi:MFS family permease
MTAKPAADEILLSRVLLLLALSVFINYLDRGNLSIAAPLLKNEFQLSATHLGVLLSSFFWTYSFFLPVSGWYKRSTIRSTATSQALPKMRIHEFLNRSSSPSG